MRPKKTELGAQMLIKLARRFPNLTFRVAADHLHNGRTVLHAVLSEVSNVHIIARGRPDAALYAMPAPRVQGQRGRPRVRGQRIASPRDWAEANPQAFKTQTIEMYGRQVTVKVGSFLGMAYKSLPGRLLRYVVVRDPSEVYRPDYILCTDIDIDEATILQAYAQRWPIERALRRAIWAERFVDPPSGDPPRSEVWADYLARVVAAA